jgi:hypothetical protein
VGGTAYEAAQRDKSLHYEKFTGFVWKYSSCSQNLRATLNRYAMTFGRREFAGMFWKEASF